MGDISIDDGERATIQSLLSEWSGRQDVNLVIVDLPVGSSDNQKLTRKELQNRARWRTRNRQDRIRQAKQKIQQGKKLLRDNNLTIDNTDGILKKFFTWMLPPQKKDPTSDTNNETKDGVGGMTQGEEKADAGAKAAAGAKAEAEPFQQATDSDLEAATSLSAEVKTAREAQEEKTEELTRLLTADTATTTSQQGGGDTNIPQLVNNYNASRKDY